MEDQPKIYKSELDLDEFLKLMRSSSRRLHNLLQSINEIEKRIDNIYKIHNIRKRLSRKRISRERLSHDFKKQR